MINSTPEPDHAVRLQAADRIFKARGKARGGALEQLHDEIDVDTPTEVEEFDPKDQALFRHTSTIEAEIGALAGAIETRPINVSGAPSEQAAGNAGKHAAMPTGDPVGQGPIGQTNAMRVELTGASDDGGGANQAIRDQLEQPGNVREVAPESGHGAEVANNQPES